MERDTVFNWLSMPMEVGEEGGGTYTYSVDGGKFS